MLVCFLWLFLSRGRAKYRGNRSYVVVNGSRRPLLHTRQGNAPWALSGDFQVEDLVEADKRAKTKRGIITRSFPAVWLEGPPKCDQIFPTRADQGFQSARFSIQLVRAGRVGIILALCASKMPVGDTSRPSKHPMNQPWRCGGVCNRFNTVTEIRSIQRFTRNFGVNRSCSLSRIISRANAHGKLKIA